MSTDGHVHYYINDGIYHSFIISYIYDLKVPFKIIRKTEQVNEPINYPSTIWGQTCNTKDKIVDSQSIPELEIGDFMVFENMGAYTTNLSSQFNGFKIGEIININSKDDCVL